MFFFMTLTHPTSQTKRTIEAGSNSRIAWTEDLDAMGRELLINEDWPPIYAARRLGVSPNALTSRATRMGWRRGGSA